MEFFCLTKKAQSAIEFVILVGAVLFFFVAFLVIIQENLAQKKYEINNLAVKEIALTIQDELNLASSASEGYFRQFVLPSNVNGLDYEVGLLEDVVHVKTLNERHAISFPIPSVTGNVIIGVNYVKKENGEILVNS